MGFVKLKDIIKTYMLGKIEVPALRGINLNIDKGDFVSIAGPSGSGKTTLLNLLGCIDKASDGTIEIDGQVINNLSDRESTTLRHKILGFIFQSFNLIPVLNIYENIEFPLLVGSHVLKKKEREKWINALIDKTGLSKWKYHRPNELSGGQRQRVAIARALVTKPKIVLADEPTANLDSKTGENILKLMKEINSEYDTTFIFSTHDPSIVALADHVIKLHDGSIIFEEKKE